MIINKLASHHLAVKEFDQAIEILNSLHQKLKNINQELGYGVLYHMADCYLQKNEFEKAKSLLSECLSGLEKHNETSSYVPVVLYLSGIVRLKTDESGEAVEFFKRAKEFVGNIDAEQKQFDTLVSDQFDKLKKDISQVNQEITNLPQSETQK